jgi:hypothetical protein
MSVSEFPGRPRLLKGALVIFASKVPTPTGVIVFQYNPETMTRRLEAATRDAATTPQPGDPKGSHGVPPSETITLAVELSAIDGLDRGDPTAEAVGIHPALAALESLMYPGAGILELNKALAERGIATIAPAAVPIVLLFWGAARVVPVRVTAVTVTETQFDPQLNPIQAKVELALRALTDADLSEAPLAFRQLPLVRTVAREVLAARNAAAGAAEVMGSISL